MKKSNLIIGITLIFIGILWFLDSLNVFYFSFRDLFDYLKHLFKVWPLFVIYLGIKLITDNKIVAWIYTAISITFVVFYSLGYFLNLDILR